MADLERDAYRWDVARTKYLSANTYEARMAAWRKKKDQHDYEYQDVIAFIEIGNWFFTRWVQIPLWLIVSACLVIPILKANGFV
jgi:hypothetical protein